MTDALAEKIKFIQGFDGESHPTLKAKLIPREELKDLGEFLAKRGIRKSFTTGAYDMIHIGHARYLELARRLAGELGILLVGLNSDKSVQALKGSSRPILEEIKRAEMLAFLQSVSFITIFDELTGGEIIKLFKPDAYLCVEGSWQGDLAAKDEVQQILTVGGEAYYTPRQDPNLSTTAIIDRIQTVYGDQLMTLFQGLVRKGEAK